jgi:hypothetical protein
MKFISSSLRRCRVAEADCARKEQKAFNSPRRPVVSLMALLTASVLTSAGQPGAQLRLVNPLNIDARAEHVPAPVRQVNAITTCAPINECSRDETFIHEACLIFTSIRSQWPVVSGQWPAWVD